MQHKYWELIHRIQHYITKGTYPDQIPDMAPKTLEKPVETPLTEGSLESLSHYVQSCAKCPIAQGNKAIFGVGTLGAQLLVVAPPALLSNGVAPLGKAGYHYLGQWVKAIQLDIKKDVYLTNTVKCPATQEHHPIRIVENCMPYLRHQITLIKPKAILILGVTGATQFFGSMDPAGESGKEIADYRGSIHFHGAIPVVVTYHPSEVLRRDTLRKAVWDDLKLLRGAMEPAGESV